MAVKQAITNPTSSFDSTDRLALGLKFDGHPTKQEYRITAAIAIGLIMGSTTPQSQIKNIPIHCLPNLESEISKNWDSNVTFKLAEQPVMYSSASLFDLYSPQNLIVEEATFIDGILDKTKKIISETGRKSFALDFLMKEIDSKLLTGNYSFGDAFLKKINLEEFPTAFPVTILTLTLPWKQSLKGRDLFYSNTKKYLTKMYSRHEDVERTLSGLE